MSLWKLFCQRPIVGFVTGSISWVTSFIEAATPIVQFITAVCGLGLIIITSMIKARQWIRDK